MKRKKSNNGRPIKFYRKNDKGEWVPIGDGTIEPFIIPEHKSKNVKNIKKKYKFDPAKTISTTMNYIPETDQRILALRTFFNEEEQN